MANAVWEAFEDDDAVALEAALKKCGNPNVILINGENPLACQAARLCRRNVLRAALRWDGWAATAADKELRTPLHYAALAGDMESAQTLLELKPDRVRDEMLIKQQDSAKEQWETAGGVIERLQQGQQLYQQGEMFYEVLNRLAQKQDSARRTAG